MTHLLLVPCYSKHFAQSDHYYNFPHFLDDMTSPTYKYVNKLQGKRILIFGGTSGIGFAVAEASIEHGATVIISGSNPEKLSKTVQRLKTSYPNVSNTQIITKVCDLSDADNLEANIESLLSVVTDGGKAKLNHVIYTAGDALRLIPVSQITIEALNKASIVRTMGPVILAKYLLQYLEKSPDSSYTMTGGVNGTKPAPGWSMMAGGATSLGGLTRGLAVDMAPVRVNIVSPGAIKTELFANMSEEVIEKMKLATTVQRLGRPEDIAEAYMYLMKDGFVTGSQIDSNGGRLLV